MYGAYEKIDNGDANWNGNLYNFKFPAKNVDSDSENIEEKHYNFKYNFPVATDINNELASNEQAFPAKKVDSDQENLTKHRRYNFKYNFPVITDFDNQLAIKEEAFPDLDSSAHWNVWKKAAESHVKNDYKEAASFLYCALNQHVL